MGAGGQGDIHPSEPLRTSPVDLRITKLGKADLRFPSANSGAQVCPAMRASGQDRTGGQHCCPIAEMREARPEVCGGDLRGSHSWSRARAARELGPHADLDNSQVMQPTRTLV